MVQMISESGKPTQDIVEEVIKRRALNILFSSENKATFANAFIDGYLLILIDERLASVRF